MNRIAIVLAAACLLPAAMQARAEGPALTLREGDRIVFLGNTFAERLRHFNYFETLLTVRFPELSLTFRNLGWSADEVALRPRPLDFGDIHSHLEKQQADVIFVCYGLNESFAGEAGLDKFRAELDGLLGELLSHRYNGESTPRLVLVSPTPQEGFPGFPRLDQRNAEIALYCAALREAAAARGIPYIDLFGPVSDLMKNPRIGRLTFNGVHMEEYGYWIVSQLMMDALGFAPIGPAIELDAAAGTVKFEGEVDVSDVATDGPGIAFSMRYDGHLPVPPPPNAEVDDALLVAHPRVAIKSLKPGRYALLAAGRIVATADHRQWEAGVRIFEDPAHRTTETLRDTIREKNQLFFDRWRAVNGFYIYGGRKEPFGVISFPPEMERFDQLVADFDARIKQLNRPEPPVRFRLMPAD